MKQNQSLKKQLNQRFSIENICYEHYYIQRMNMKMQITTDTFLHDPKLKNYSKLQIINAISASNLFKPVYNTAKSRDSVEKFRLQYPDCQKTIIVTGINPENLKKFIEEFYRRNFQRLKRKPQQFENPHWSIIKLTTPDLARQFKKSFRQKKKNHDMQHDLSYKIDQKRVRIIILNEDFFTILIDAMNQTLTSKFIKNFGKENENKFIYQKIHFRYQDQYVLRVEEEYQDAYSEEKSITTQSHENRNLDDYIEKTDQGIQAGKVQQSTHQSCKLNGEINIQHKMKRQIGVGTEELKKKLIEKPNLRKDRKNKKQQTQIVEIVQTGIMIQTQQKNHQNEHYGEQNVNGQQQSIKLIDKNDQYDITLNISCIGNHKAKQNDNSQQKGLPMQKQLKQLIPQKQILKNANKQKRKQYQYSFIRKLQRKIDINSKKYSFNLDIPNYLLKQSQKQLNRKKWFTALQNQIRAKKKGIQAKF